MKEYEVIIIGAGPAGLQCAKTLEANNKKVLLLEQNKIIGPKICAGGIGDKEIKFLNFPKELLSFTSNKFYINTPLQRDEIKMNIHTIDRKVLGQWQLKQLKKTEVRTNTRVKKITKDYIETDKEKIKYKYLIGADGSSSIVRNYLSIGTNKTALAIQYIIPNTKHKDLEFYLNSELFKSFYAWIFPNKKFTSIGSVTLPKFMSTSMLKKNFSKWLKEKKINISKAKFQAQIINGDYQGYKFGNIFLIGDAAGLTPSITGKGIYPALISGEEVAKIILNPKYNSRKMKKILKTREYQEKITDILNESGFLREIEFELFALLVKNKYAEKYFIKKLS